MTTEQLREELNNCESEYQAQRELFISDGEIDENEQAELDEIEDLILSLRQMLDDRLEEGGEEGISREYPPSSPHSIPGEEEGEAGIDESLPESEMEGRGPSDGGPPSGVAEVAVIDRTTQEPIAGAHVRVGEVTGTTDAQGMAILEGVTVGMVQLTASAENYRERSVDQEVAAGVRSMLSIDLEPLGTESSGSEAAAPSEEARTRRSSDGVRRRVLRFTFQRDRGLFSETIQAALREQLDSDIVETVMRNSESQMNAAYRQIETAGTQDGTEITINMRIVENEHGSADHIELTPTGSTVVQGDEETVAVGPPSEEEQQQAMDRYAEEQGISVSEVHWTPLGPQRVFGRGSLQTEMPTRSLEPEPVDPASWVREEERALSDEEVQRLVETDPAWQRAYQAASFQAHGRGVMESNLPLPSLGDGELTPEEQRLILIQTRAYYGAQRRAEGQ